MRGTVHLAIGIIVFFNMKGRVSPSMRGWTTTGNGWVGDGPWTGSFGD